MDFEVELSVDGQKYETLQKVTDNTEDITKLELSEAKEARYVKVTITNPCNRPGQPSDKTARIGEMRFYDDRNVNLITGEQEESEEPEGKGTVTGCGEIVDADPTWSYLLKGIIDGKMDADNTTWACNGKTHKDDDTEKESQHWFQVDFGEKLPLKKCILFHHGALNGGKTMTTSDYKVEVSADGTNYETVEEVKDNTKNITKHELNTVEEVQYVRVTITKANAEKDTTGRMRELLFLDENSVNLLTGELVEDYINDFSEELDITDGVVKTDVAGIPVRCSSWVAATDNVMVTEVTSLSDKPIELEGAVWTRTDVEEYPRDTGVEGDQIWASKKSANKVENQNEQSWTSEVQVRAKALGTEVKAAENSEAESGLRFTLEPGKTVQIVTAVGGGGQTYDWQGTRKETDPGDEAKTILAKYNSAADLEKLKTDNDRWWEKYWMKSHIDIGDDLLHRYYYGSLYYMGCTSRDNTLPTGLYGIWTTTDSAMWNGDYHMNYNYIAPFYGMYSSNRYEQAKSLKNPLMDYMENGKKNAKEDLEKIYNNYINGGSYAGNFGGGWSVYSDGYDEGSFEGRPDLKDGIDDAVLYPVSLGPWGSSPWHPNGGYLMQMYNAGFPAMALTAYYNYTKDADYLREIQFYLEANANFFEKWCEKVTEEVLA